MNSEMLQIEKSTRDWVEQVIVGFNFCPFAKREVVRESIRYKIIDYPKSKKSAFFDALDTLKSEFEYLDQNETTETTLVVFSDLLSDFDSFLDFLHFAEKLLLDEGYEGIYQLAHFHPEYCFEGEAYDDPANYTNRSPYPTLHIIREATMEQVLSRIENPEEIPERNIELARELGNQKLAAILHGCLTGEKSKK